MSKSARVLLSVVGIGLILYGVLGMLGLNEGLNAFLKELYSSIFGN